MAKPVKRGQKPPPQYPRGFTAQAPAPPDRRPPKLSGGVFNEFDPKTRGALMSPPTGDTQEPRLSRWEGGPVLGPMAKGGLAKRFAKGKR